MMCKRIWESIEYVFCLICLMCEGWGSVKMVEMVCFEILCEIMCVNWVYDVDKFVVYVLLVVVDIL